MPELEHGTNYYTTDAFNSEFSLPAKRFSLLHINSRSLKNKVDAITNFLHSCTVSFDVIMFSETWIHGNEVPYISGYHSEHLCRSAKKGGGVAIYFKDTLTCEKLPHLSVINDDVECLALRIGKVLAVVVYRPPLGKEVNFLHFFETLLCDNSFTLGSFVIMGDINIDLKSSHTYSREFTTMLDTYACKNYVDIPTRITTHSATLLDVCITNLCTDYIKTGVFSSDISDHLPVFLLATLYENKPQEQMCSRRNLNDISREVFRNLVQGLDWSIILDQADANTAYDMFFEMIHKCFDNAFPLKKIMVQRNKKYRKPWINKGLYQRIKAKNKLYHEFISCRDPEVFCRYKKIRNTLNADLRKAKKNYYTAKFESIYDNPKKVWQMVNALTNRMEQCSDIKEMTINGTTIYGEDLANSINAHFINAGCYEEPNDIDRDTNIPDTPMIEHTIFLQPTSPAEVEASIRLLKSNVAPGIDEIGAKELKQVSHLISEAVAHIVNLMLSTGVFPQKLKVARVTAIFKGGLRNNLSNYRPISVLPIMSKIFESVINQRLVSFFDKHKILSNSQYGFRKNRSTEKALCYIKDSILTNIDSKNFTLGLFLDLKKAFDSIKYNILYDKLSRYGVRGVALELIKNYLSHRSQIVQIQNAKSSKLKLTQGVPQGSILGPFLFLVYINDIVTIANSPEIIMYADDTNVFFKSTDLTDLETKANEYLALLSTWLGQNRLQLNIAKTNYVIFRALNKQLSREIVLTFQGHELTRVKEQKFLGVWFQEHLSWNVHVNNLVVELSRAVGCLYKIAPLIPIWLKQNLYNSLFYSRLCYGILVWGTTTKTNYNRIIRLQKMILRIYESYQGPWYQLSTSPLFLKYQMLQANKVYDFKLLQYIHSNALYLDDSSSNEVPYDMRLKRRRTLKTRTNYGTQTTSHQVLMILNKLEGHIEFFTTRNAFKNKVKELLLAQALRE